MNKIKIQLEFLYLQIESLDEFAFQNMKPKQREMQIRMLVSNSAIIMIRTSDDVVSYAPMEQCTSLINAMSNVIYPRLATSLNRAYEIKTALNKYGQKLTEDRLAKLITETVEEVYKALQSEVFELPATFIPGLQKGGMA